jgi:hypothetical protein
LVFVHDVSFVVTTTNCPKRRRKDLTQVNEF